jgi:hypothetical protein
MNLFEKIGAVFWKRLEGRLRAFWRVGLHGALFFLLTSAFSTLLYAVASNLNILSASNIQNLAAANRPLLAALISPTATFLMMLAATFLAGRWIDRRKFTAFGLHFSPAWWGDLGFGLVLGAVLMGLIFGVGLLTGTIAVEDMLVSHLPSRTFFPVFMYVLVKYIFVGIYEELAFRGYYLINLAEGFYSLTPVSRRNGVLFAWTVSSVVFGFLHAFNPNASLISTLNIILAGLFMGLGMLLTGELAIPIGVHISWNFFQGAVFGFPVSGTRNAGTVIGTKLTGPAWFTGGSFGPEAGVLGLLALILGCLLTVLWVRRKGRFAIEESLAVYQNDQPAGEQPVE